MLESVDVGRQFVGDYEPTAGREVVERLRALAEPRPRDLMDALASSYKRGKPDFIVVAAEFESRLTILGHVRRGGSPTAYDRLLGSRLGGAALQALVAGESGVMVGVSGARVERYPLEEVAARKRTLDEGTYDLALILAGMRRDEDAGP